MFVQFFVLFALMGIGYLSSEKNWLNETSIKGLGSMLINVIIPALLLSSTFALDIGGGLLREFGAMVLLSAAFFTLYAFFSALYVRLRNIPSDQRGMIQLFILSTNNGFIGLPISAAFFGEKGLFLMIANNLVMNIVLFSYGVILVKSKPEGEGISYGKAISASLKQLVNPSVISIFVGLLLGVSDLVQWVPEAVILLADSLGSIATPLSMIYIGVILHSSSFALLFRNRLVIEAGVIRGTLPPLITYFILFFLPIPSLMSRIIFFAAMLPTAAIIPVLVAQYGQGEEQAAKLVLFSTLLSLVTMPVGVFLASASF